MKLEASSKFDDFGEAVERYIRMLNYMDTLIRTVRKTVHVELKTVDNKFIMNVYSNKDK